MSHQIRARASYDLHLHTRWSYDASADPEHCLARASSLGMRCLAITEHHNLDSQQEIFAAAVRHGGVRILRAAELSVSTSIGPVDLVCIGFPEAWPEALRGLMDRYHRWQREYGSALCRGMQALGFDYTDRDRTKLLESYRPRQVLALQGATHVSNEIQRDYFLERGFIAGKDEYAPLLGRLRQQQGLPGYPPAHEVVPIVHTVGALVIIAHPAEYFHGADLARMDALRAECQLDGIECAHPAVPLELTPVYRQYCRQHGLLSTAGTDCHCDREIDQMLGCHGGEEPWLDELLERVEQ
jgi:predicted metal-dependent phosphoesterase TrpH